MSNVIWADPKEIAEDMETNPQKYTAGFRSTLKLFLEHS